jgi:hypothetical protein
VDIDSSREERPSAVELLWTIRRRLSLSRTTSAAASEGGRLFAAMAALGQCSPAVAGRHVS